MSLTKLVQALLLSLAPVVPTKVCSDDKGRINFGIRGFNSRFASRHFDAYLLEDDEYEYTIIRARKEDKRNG